MCSQRSMEIPKKVHMFKPELRFNSVYRFVSSVVRLYTRGPFWRGKPDDKDPTDFKGDLFELPREWKEHSRWTVKNIRPIASILLVVSSSSRSFSKAHTVLFYMTISGSFCVITNKFLCSMFRYEINLIVDYTSRSENSCEFI